MIKGYWRETSRKTRKLPDHATYRSTAAANAVAGGGNAGTVEVGVVGVRLTVDRARPVVAAATATEQRAIEDVASADKEQGRSSNLIKTVSGVASSC